MRSSETNSTVTNVSFFIQITNSTVPTWIALTFIDYDFAESARVSYRASAEIGGIVLTRTTVQTRHCFADGCFSTAADDLVFHVVLSPDPESRLRHCVQGNPRAAGNDLAVEGYFCGIWPG